MEFIEAFTIYGIILLVLALVAIYMLPVFAAIFLTITIIGKIIQLIAKKRTQARKEAAARAYDDRVRTKEEQKARNEAYNQAALEQMAMMRSPLIERRAKNTVFLYGFPDMPAGTDEKRRSEYFSIFSRLKIGDGYRTSNGRYVLSYHCDDDILKFVIEYMEKRYAVSVYGFKRKNFDVSDLFVFVTKCISEQGDKFIKIW